MLLVFQSLVELGRNTHPILKQLPPLWVPPPTCLSPGLPCSSKIMEITALYDVATKRLQMFSSSGSLKTLSGWKGENFAIQSSAHYGL